MSLYSDDEYLDNLERENISLATFSKRMSAFVIDDLLMGIITIILFWNIISSNLNIEVIIREINSNIMFILII